MSRPSEASGAGSPRTRAMRLALCCAVVAAVTFRHELAGVSETTDTLVTNVQRPTAPNSSLHADERERGLNSTPVESRVRAPRVDNPAVPDHTLHRLGRVSDMSLVKLRVDGVAGCGLPKGEPYCASGEGTAVPGSASTNATSLARACRIPTSAAGSLENADRQRRIRERLTDARAGGPVKLTILGGSMTLGGNCARVAW